jgi:hypothetical protein
MIGLDGEGENIPPFFLTLLGNELLTASFERPCKNGLTSFGAPDEMVHNQVYAVLISLVL